MRRLPEGQKQHLLEGLQRAGTWNNLWLNRTELGSEAKTQDESMALRYGVNRGHSFIYLKNADLSLPPLTECFPQAVLCTGIYGLRIYKDPQDTAFSPCRGAGE